MTNQTVSNSTMPRSLSEKTGKNSKALDTGSGDLQFIEELNMLFLRMMGEIILSPEDKPVPLSKLTHSQSRVLLFIALRGPQKMSDIARLLSIGLPSTTPVVDALVAMKLAKRRQDPNDRRVVRLELTAAGRRIQKQMAQHHADKLKQAFGHLAAVQEKELLEHLRQIVLLMRPIQPPTTS